MNRTDTIKHIALSADLSRDAAGRVIDVLEARLKAHTGAGKRVVLRGFGSFSRGLPAEKAGRNPRTGTPITYTAYRKPKDTPAIGEAALRDEIAAGAQIDRAAAGRTRCRAGGDRHEHEERRRGELLRPGALLRRPPCRAQRAQSPHWRDPPDPCRTFATVSRLEDRQRRRQVQSRRAPEGGGELTRRHDRETWPGRR